MLPTNPFKKGAHRMKKKKRIAVSLVLALVIGLSIACEDMLDEMLREIIGSVGVDAMRAAFIDSRRVLDDGLIHVILAGTGSPRIDAVRSHPCTAVVANGQLLIFDAGPRAVAQLALQGYPIMDVEYVFLTHMHSDHMGGIANLINLSYVNGRRTVVHIYGPDDSKNLTHSLYPPTSKEYRAGYETITPFGLPDTREINELDADDLRNGLVWDTGPEPDLVYIPGVSDMVDGINMAYAADVVIRTSSKQIPEVPDGWAYNMAVAHPLADMPNTGEANHGWGELLEVITFPDNGSGHGPLVVKAFLVDHYPAFPSYGYRIEYSGKVIVISGDTESLMPYDAEPGEQSYWATYAQNADIFVHEANSQVITDIMLNAILDEPDLLAVPAVVSIVAQFRGASDHHTDVLDVARAAAEANAARLVLTHIGFPTPNDLIKDFVVEGMDAFYTGQIILGSDGMDIELVP